MSHTYLVLLIALTNRIFQRGLFLTINRRGLIFERTILSILKILKVAPATTEQFSCILFNKEEFLKTIRVITFGFYWLSFKLIGYCGFLIPLCYPLYFFVLGWGGGGDIFYFSNLFSFVFYLMFISYVLCYKD